MQRDSQIRLVGYGDLKMAPGHCGGQVGGHCGLWVARVEIISSKTPELAVAVNARRASLAQRGKADPGQLRWTQSRRLAWSLRMNS